MPRMGISGAAIATTLSYMLSSTLFLTVGNKRLSITGSRALLCPLPALVLVGAHLSPDSVALHVALLIGTVILVLFFAKWWRLFSKQDADVLEKMEMPILFKQGIRHVILALSR